MFQIKTDGTEVAVSTIKMCDICVHVEHRAEPLIAFFDTRTTDGRWGNLCGLHIDTHGMYAETDLGVGKGQKLIYPNGLVQHYLDTGEVSA